MLFEFIIALITFILLISTLVIFFKDSLINYCAIYLAKAMYLYNKSKRPERIILVRHGQSQANVDLSLYKRLPDNRIGLTDLGKQQAQEAGKKIKQLIGDGSIRFFVSPYKRTRQTYNCILESLKDNKYLTSYDNRLREQEYGNIQKDMEEQFKEMKICGEFFYRFTNGENGADVFNRGKKI